MRLFILLLLLPLTAFAQEIRILSWNIFMLPKPIKFSYQKERTEYIIQHLAKENFDVVLLQEAFSGDFRNKVQDSLKKLYPHQSYLDRQSGSLTVYGSGAYILSKYPIGRNEFAYYADCGKSDCFASKGVSLSTITHPSGKMIQIANTHLQSGKEKSKIRFKQLEQVKRLIETYKIKDVPQVLVGDLNIDALTGNDYQKMLDLLNMKSHSLEGSPQYTNGFPIECYNKPGDDQLEWLDHIVINRDFTGSLKKKKVRVFTATLEGKECPLSDHYAVEATISFQGIQ